MGWVNEVGGWILKTWRLRTTHPPTLSMRLIWGKNPKAKQTEETTEPTTSINQAHWVFATAWKRARRPVMPAMEAKKEAAPTPQHWHLVGASSPSARGRKA